MSCSRMDSRFRGNDNLGWGLPAQLQPHRNLTNVIPAKAGIHSWFGLSLSLALLTWATSCTAAQAQPAAPSPRAEFAEICRQTKASDLPWYGERVSTELGRRLADQWFEPADEARVRYRLGIELLKLSRPGEAVENLKRALELLDQALPGDKERWGMMWFLGLSYLQLAEDQNCVERHNQASCLLPIRPEGVHSKPEAARKAADVFLAIVAHEPKHIQAAWLFDLAKMLSGEYPFGVPPSMRLPEKALQPEADFPRWLDRAPGSASTPSTSRAAPGWRTTTATACSTWSPPPGTSAARCTASATTARAGSRT